MINIWIKSALIGAALTCAFIAKHKFNFKDDNPIEERVEDFIKMQTGIEIDLTPLSPEEAK